MRVVTAAAHLHALEQLGGALAQAILVKLAAPPFSRRHSPERSRRGQPEVLRDDLKRQLERSQLVRRRHRRHRVGAARSAVGLSEDKASNVLGSVGAGGECGAEEALDDDDLTGPRLAVQHGAVGGGEQQPLRERHVIDVVVERVAA